MFRVLSRTVLAYVYLSTLLLGKQSDTKKHGIALNGSVVSISNKVRCQNVYHNHICAGIYLFIDPVSVVRRMELRIKITADDYALAS